MATSTAADRWRDALEARRIPPAILEKAPEPPWGFPVGLFEVRAANAGGVDDAPTTRRAWAALPEGGRVVDVGCGGGATSLPLASRAGLITGVDQQADMLASFTRAVTDAGGRAATVEGTWPDVADEVAAADVVLCGHVLYNVADLVPFLAALDATATSRVVVEITDRHPLVWMNDLWREFHAVTFPDGPSADDAAAVIAAAGLQVHREDRPPDPSRGGGFPDREDAVAFVRRRLCLDPSRDDDVERVLGDRLRERDGRWSAGPPEGTPASTLWWDVAPPG
ncbi:MAG TPA: methyltransferase domain-containing protein [Actinomycetota bacterium]|nr:methyltransferase domain-containing protein [Actinomycetota bacterium]